METLIILTIIFAVVIVAMFFVFRNQINSLKNYYERQIAETKENNENQLAAAKEANEKQLEAIKELNKVQLETQVKLIKEQIQTTSENILKRRQEELGSANKEQVSKIISPIEQSLQEMRRALHQNQKDHQEAINKLDATIKANMENSASLGESADRLTRALTGEVKVQGNFGELKLKQLLEDLGLKDGEQYSSQTHLRDKFGNLIKDDEGKGLIPDFILHFPNNREVIVDSKMSFTAYERYVNCDDQEQRTQHLKDHIVSVRAQVKRLAEKDYSKYLLEGYSKLNFVIMYIHTDGALNLALLNDTSLWKEAYDKGVLILGPQTMYMNLRILELMWTQNRQIHNQEAMIKAANTIIDRTQDFASRFADVENKMNATVKSMNQLKVTTADNGASIITAAKSLINAGARENKKKKSILDTTEDAPLYLESEDSLFG
ncbi:MAG: DNA recombination protein RmuC [Paludibacteraceae bacterium]|nr:DNA recombination protein RmuC [Paludibacteraceae bacterium]